MDIIPTPRKCRSSGRRVSLAAGAASPLAIVLSRNATPKEKLAARAISGRLRDLGAAAIETFACGTRRHSGGARIFLSSWNRRRGIDAKARSILKANAVSRFFSRCANPEQGYVLSVDDGRIVIMGGSDQGTLYGAMTLLQLLKQDGHAVSAPAVHLEDWPDFKNRAAENWTFLEGREREGPGWCYDWGNGLHDYMQRAKRIINRALQYKINMIHFYGCFYREYDWACQGMAFARELNQYARERGIRLVYGGMGRLHHLSKPRRVKLRNRSAYPDGPVYRCVGYPRRNTHPQRKTIHCRTSALCRSNQHLDRIMHRQIRQFVAKIEPGALLLHFEDLGYYREVVQWWRMRCAECRRRWPNDALEAPDGGAAAIAHSYDAACKAVFNVKNEKTGYDAARDCMVILASPCYTVDEESDEDWNRELILWKNILTLMKHKQNINYCLREQFLRHDGARPRIKEISDLMRDHGIRAGVHLFSCNEWGRPMLFNTVPVMSCVFQGAETLYNMCGRMFQEPLILLNAEYMWNSTPDGACEKHATYHTYKRRFHQHIRNQTRPQYIFGKGRFLETACARLYGEKAAAHMKKIYRMQDEVLCYGRFALWGGRGAPGFDWLATARATRRAATHARAALAVMHPRRENRDLVERFLLACRLGERFAILRRDCDNLRKSANSRARAAQNLDKEAAALGRFVRDNFGLDWATPGGGDARHWLDAIRQTRREIRRAMAPASVHREKPRKKPLFEGFDDSTDAAPT